MSYKFKQFIILTVILSLLFALVIGIVTFTSFRESKHNISIMVTNGSNLSGWQSDIIKVNNYPVFFKRSYNKKLGDRITASEFIKTDIAQSHLNSWKATRKYISGFLNFQAANTRLNFHGYSMTEIVLKAVSSILLMGALLSSFFTFSSFRRAAFSALSFIIIAIGEVFCLQSAFGFFRGMWGHDDDW
jgi:hypothetical protein